MMPYTAPNRARLSYTSTCIAATLWLALATALWAPAAQALPATSVEDDQLKALAWREIGPYRGGRSAAVDGVESQPNVYYFGATGGGVWKTIDAGKTWSNVSDGYFGGSIGAVAVSQWDPNVLYVGGGEKTVRGNVSHGKGVWKSTDAGKTWTHIGLADTRHIPRIRVHPRNPDLVYVAALGHLFGPNEERGVFRSRDGGKTWEKILYAGPDAGAVDLILDPTNPRTLYASLWRVRRTPFSLESGGEGSGLWKSTDGGDTWKELSTNKGFPKGTLGIIGITASLSDPENLYAMVEAEQGGVYRSRDGGDTWTKTNDERNLRQRAWYYTRIYADPADAETVYVLNVRFHRSQDGGKTFQQVPTPHGDNHDLWIDPADPLRMIEANDGGANVSFDGGKTWSPQDNQPTAQMYRLSVDNAFPYRILGGQQDNSAVRIRSRSSLGRQISTRDWEPTAGGESGHIVAHPEEPDVVFGGSYGGFLVRFDHRTGERRLINVWPEDPMGWGAAELEYRFNWNFPLAISSHDPDLIYAAGNVLFASRDGGASWRALGHDLTRNAKDKQGPSGGPITKDNTSVEYYGTIFAIAESPLTPGILWAGSDDGLVNLSRDGGETWQDVTPKGLPEWAQINGIDPHPGESGGLYVAATRYKLDDFAPYLFRTTNYGKTWKRIDKGIPRDQFTRVIRADPERPGLLFAGTEEGIYASFDDGTSWRSLQLELPIVPITDLAVKEGDLVAATQGRGYWILDDLSPLRQLGTEAAPGPLHLFQPRPAHRLRGSNRRGDGPHRAGQNPPTGVIFHYHLEEELGAEDELELEILDPEGEPIKTFTRKPADDTEDEKTDGPPRGEDLRQLEAAKGLNRFVWDLRYPEAERFPGMVLWNSNLAGPIAAPGAYRARLRLGEETREVPFQVLVDPRSSTPEAELRTQVAFHLELRDKLSEMHGQIGRIRKVKGQLEALEKRLGDDTLAAVKTASVELREQLESIEKALYQTQNRSRQDPLNYPIRLNDKLAGLMSAAATGDYPPTAQMLTVRDRLLTAIDHELGLLEALWANDLPALNKLAREQEVPLISEGEKPKEP